jgi:hypothetical protein
MSFREVLGEIDDEFLMLPPEFDDALVGFVQVFSRQAACYDQERVLEILESQGMSEQAALDYFEFNVVGAYVGEKTPAFLTMFRLPVKAGEVPCPTCAQGAKVVHLCEGCQKVGCVSCQTQGLCYKCLTPEARA